MKYDDMVYNIVETNGIFIGLNNRAINFMLENGSWYKLTDAEAYGYTGETGMLFINYSESESDQAQLAGSLYKDFIIPTIVYDWHPSVKESDPDDINLIPLYKYKVREDLLNTSWLYEKIDNKMSDTYPNIKLMCLVDEEGNQLFEWTDEELELSELMFEYIMGL